MSKYITTRTDLVTYLQDTRGDLYALGDEYVEAVADQIQVSDHPAWGSDWEEWLADPSVDGLIEETLHGLDAIESYRVVVGERGSDQGHILPAQDEHTARQILDEQLARYDGDGWGRIEYRRPGGWDRLP